jgi:hypothetical protein
VTDDEQFGFTFADQTWTVTRSDGVEVPLVPSGETRLVTPATRHAYVAAAAAARRAESAPAVSALRAGLLDVLPPQLLALWPPAALERAVCGDPEVPIEALRRCTTVTLAPEVAAAFWGAVELMTHLQRSSLLRFATGRQRLPVNLRVESLRCDDEHVPHAASCYMLLQLPNYRTPQRALEKMLLYL